MIPLIGDNRKQIERLCRQFHVERLELFGSAADGAFDPVRSDVDLLVEFKPLEPRALADAYFGLLADIRTACEFILDRTRSLTLTEYENDRTVSAAVERHFITIGEALSRLEPISVGPLSRRL